MIFNVQFTSFEVPRALVNRLSYGPYPSELKLDENAFLLQR